jgi:hypothetical protein
MLRHAISTISSALADGNRISRPSPSVKVASGGQCRDVDHLGWVDR